jgi:tRNA threonylcarbamoyladenosine biosynthesis protein TsaE
LQQQCQLNTEAQLQALGQQLAQCLQAQAKTDCIITLSGDLGAGKSTLIRALIQQLGHLGKVKSPTYTLVEPYCIEQQTIYHYDFYRIHEPEALEAMGIRDYFSKPAYHLIEWPEQGIGFLPEADISITIIIQEGWREIYLLAQSISGKEILQDFTCPVGAT